MVKEIILTGIRANDTPTLGNYLGAILPMVQLQKQFAGDYQLNMFVPDLHSFTTPIDHTQLFNNTIRNLKFFVAAGLDIHNQDTYIYRQSYISAHSEMAWILNCFAYMGELGRMTQYKEKSEKWGVIDNITGKFDEFEDQSYAKSKAEQSVSVGLFDYPVLMAADILLYGAKWVPVGEDQRQHLELARDLGQRLNNKFGGLLTVPEDWTKQLAFTKRDNGVRIRSLSNPEKKMSKSISDPRGTILLTDGPKDAAKKVMSATTDSLGEIKFDLKERPGVSNLLQMLALLSGESLDVVIAKWEGQTRYGELKTEVAGRVESFLNDFQSKYNSVDEATLMQTLEASEEAMREVADTSLLKVQQAVGLRPSK